jgi:hypothetical protein
MQERVAKLTLEAKLDDFGVGSVSRKPRYLVGHREFARNSNPALKAQVWSQMEFCNSLARTALFFYLTGLLFSGCLGR